MRVKVDNLGDFRPCSSDLLSSGFAWSVDLLPSFRISLSGASYMDNFTSEGGRDALSVNVGKTYALTLRRIQENSDISRTY